MPYAALGAACSWFLGAFFHLAECGTCRAGHCPQRKRRQIYPVGLLLARLSGRTALMGELVATWAVETQKHELLALGQHWSGDTAVIAVWISFDTGRVIPPPSSASSAG